MWDFWTGFIVGALLGYVVCENDELKIRVERLENGNLDYARRAGNL